MSGVVWVFRLETGDSVDKLGVRESKDCVERVGEEICTAGLDDVGMFIVLLLVWLCCVFALFRPPDVVDTI